LSKLANILLRFSWDPVKPKLFGQPAATAILRSILDDTQQKIAVNDCLECFKVAQALGRVWPPDDGCNTVNLHLRQAMNGMRNKLRHLVTPEQLPRFSLPMLCGVMYCLSSTVAPCVLGVSACSRLECAALMLVEFCMQG